MSHTETQRVTYYSGHAIEVNGRRYVPERTCRRVNSSPQEAPLPKCSECGHLMGAATNYCAHCGCRVEEGE